MPLVLDEEVLNKEDKLLAHYYRIGDSSSFLVRILRLISLMNDGVRYS